VARVTIDRLVQYEIEVSGFVGTQDELGEAAIEAFVSSILTDDDIPQEAVHTATGSFRVVDHWTPSFRVSDLVP